MSFCAAARFYGAPTIARFAEIAIEKETRLFKNLIVFRVEAGWSSTLEQAEEALNGPLRAVRPTQEKSAGWIAAARRRPWPAGRVDRRPVAPGIHGRGKSLPASVVSRRVDERAAQIEATTGRKPGKKERKELKEDVSLR